MKTYEEGILEGRVQSLEDRAVEHHKRLDHHHDRITAQERITYAILGALALIEVLPTIAEFLAK